MLMEQRDRFPVGTIKLYDNNEERQAVLGEACRILMAERYPEIRFLYTTDPEEAFTDIDFVFAHIRVGLYGMREKDEKIPLKYDVVGLSLIHIWRKIFSSGRLPDRCYRRNYRNFLRSYCRLCGRGRRQCDDAFFGDDFIISFSDSGYDHQCGDGIESV